MIKKKKHNTPADLKQILWGMSETEDSGLDLKVKGKEAKLFNFIDICQGEFSNFCGELYANR